MEDGSVRQQSQASVHLPIQGMESVVATVSGYHGSERFKLIKIISQAGASYVGALNQSTTHLVCWKFEGRKYELARKFKTVIVNHQWVEDCIKLGKRVPEHPYILHCGQEVGPLALDVPMVADKVDLLLPNQSNLCNNSKEPIIDIEGEETGHAAWTDSTLLKENLFSKPGRSKNSYCRSKTKTVKKSSRQDHSSGTKYCFNEPPLSGLIRVESEESSSPSSTQLVKQKRRSSTLTEPSRKGRRLARKSIKDFLEPFLDSEQEIHSLRVRHQHNDIPAPSKNSSGRRNKNMRIDRFIDHGGNRNEGLEDVEEIKDVNDLFAFEDSLHIQDASSSLIRTPHDHCSPVDDDLNETEPITRLSTSTELSCVICWTDFSSTRGVLPCGHRFCFSCIQSWADHMASRGKISTCPLCKSSFVGITKVKDAVSSDQKIYSQTIPHDPSMMNVYILRETPTLRAQPSLAPLCCQCCCREPEDLLIRCHLCQIRCVHSYCLDPPLLPWTCVHCKDLQMLYYHIH